MAIAKINYINEMFTNYDYVDIPSKLNLKIGNTIIVSNNSLEYILVFSFNSFFVFSISSFILLIISIVSFDVS